MKRQLCLILCLVLVLGSIPISFAVGIDGFSLPEMLLSFGIYDIGLALESKELALDYLAFKSGTNAFDGVEELYDLFETEYPNFLSDNGISLSDLEDTYQVFAGIDAGQSFASIFSRIESTKVYYEEIIERISNNYYSMGDLSDGDPETTYLFYLFELMRDEKLAVLDNGKITFNIANKVNSGTLINGPDGETYTLQNYLNLALDMSNIQVIDTAIDFIQSTAQEEVDAYISSKGNPDEWTLRVAQNLEGYGVIDYAEPELDVNVEDGDRFTNRIKLRFSVIDYMGEDIASATLNGSTVVTGTTVSVAGSYRLVITAVDGQGEMINEIIDFTVVDPPPDNNNSGGNNNDVVNIVEEEVALGIIDMGYLEIADLFRPEDFVNRGELSIWLATVLGLTSDAEESVFPDVKVEDEAFKAIHALYEVDIISGFPDGTFRSEANLTRAQMAKMMNVAMARERGNINMPSELKFKDKDLESHWAIQNIKKMVGAGLFAGYPDGYFYPENTLKRSQAVTIINRYTKREIQSELYTEQTFDDVGLSYWAFEQIEAAVRGYVTQED